jgi:PEP-CTERM motif
MNLASCFSRVAVAVRPFPFAFAVSAFAAPVAADPILIGLTSGFVDIGVAPVGDVLNADIDLSGPDFALTSSGVGITGAPCAPCPAGVMVSMNALVSAQFGSFTFQGASYQFDLFKSGGGQFIFSSPGQFTLPQSANGPVTFRSLFVLEPQSFIQAQDPAPDVLGILLSLTGRGEVALTMRPDSGPDGSNTVYFFDSMRFKFSETPAVVPEPTTLLLMGSGLTGVALQRWRRRRLS